MKKFRRLAAFFLVLFLAVGVLPGVDRDVKAAGDVPKTPVFSLKSVNKGTGVRITISNSEDVEYHIIMSNRKNAFSKYMVNNGKFDSELSYDAYEQSVTKKGKPVYTIKGLPEGTYTFKVAAYKEIRDEEEGFSYPWNTEYNITNSKEKSIKVKKAKALKSKTTKYNFSNVKKGDIIEFGSYEQDGVMTNGKEKIKWQVLNKTKNELLLFSVTSLALLPFDNSKNDAKWKDCSLRKWLNNAFYKDAFNKTEQKMIKTTQITDNYTVISKDKVFLLSGKDIYNSEYGFPDESLFENLDGYSDFWSNVMDKCDLWYSGTTAFAESQGSYDDYFADITPWWVRDDGALRLSHVPMHEGMEYGTTGVGEATAFYAVRPVIRIKLS